MANATKTITIPREEYRQLKKIRSRFEQVRTLFVDDIATEDIRLYKPAFVQKIKRATRELASGKGRVVSHPSDL